MKVYAISDLHLSLSGAKPMDIFGGAWVGYMDKLREGLSILTEEDKEAAMDVIVIHRICCILDVGLGHLQLHDQ